MKTYQVYSVDEHGSIFGNRTLEAADDEEAVFAVRSMQRPLVTEIWDRDRRVAKVEAHHRKGKPPRS